MRNPKVIVMARPSKVWYWKARKSYFVTIDGQRINLGKDKDAAEKAFHKMMAAETIPEADISVAELLDKFLEWNKANRADETFKWYNKHLQAFLDTLSNPHISASKIRPFHVNEWADKRDISSSYRRGSMVAVQRAFNWAAKQGYLESSPLANLEKPSAERREQCPTTEDYKFISQHIHGDFKDLIDFAWLTGIRPQEIFKLETKHYKNGRFEFTVKESKGKKINRVVFITKEAKAIVITPAVNMVYDVWVFTMNPLPDDAMRWIILAADRYTPISCWVLVVMYWLAFDLPRPSAWFKSVELTSLRVVI